MLQRPSLWTKLFSISLFFQKMAKNKRLTPLLGCGPMHCPDKTFIDFLFTARKRSLGQGNIFRSMCQEFCPQGGGGGCGIPACLAGHMTNQQGGASSGGACSGGGVPALEGVCSRGVPGGDPRDGYCCGRYASYWNAFLFGNFDKIVCWRPQDAESWIRPCSVLVLALPD